MNVLQKTVRRLDAYQKRRPIPAFTHAVIKKYGEDEAGYWAALLTYYGFLALFPLLMVLTTLTDIIIGNHPHLETTILQGITDYFPLLGNQLSAHIHTLHKSGAALVIGLLLTLYGTRGVADVFRHTVQHIWRIPKTERAGFPKSLFKSLGLIGVGGSGFMVASVSAGLAGAVGHGLGFRGLSIAVNLFILFWVFTFLIKFSLPQRITLKQIWVGAAAAAVGLVILQAVGGYILGRELKGLDALYSYFAVTLGLLFWLYLQAQMLCYAIEIAVVSSQKLWPRSLDGSSPTPVDTTLKTE